MWTEVWRVSCKLLWSRLGTLTDIFKLTKNFKILKLNITKLNSRFFQ